MKDTAASGSPQPEEQIAITSPAVLRNFAMLLEGFIRQHAPGGCRMLSEGSRCECPLCLVDKLLTAALASQPAGWQPIATAPKNGTWFLAWNYDCGFFVYRDGPNLIAGEDPEPTHWRHLPPAPAGAPGAQQE